LPKAESAAGGHSVPEAIIRQRFAKSIEYLESYKPLVDEWYVWDSLRASFDWRKPGMTDEQGGRHW
jgi:predicted ABC-type ATPase